MKILKNDYGDIRLRRIAVVGLAIITVFFYGFWELSVSYYKSGCYNYSRNTGAEVRFERPRWGQVFCYVKTPSGWFRLEQVNQNSVSTQLNQ